MNLQYTSKQTVPWNVFDILKVLLLSVILSVIFFVTLILASYLIHISLSFNTKFALFGIVAYLSILLSIKQLIFKKYSNVKTFIGLNTVSWKVLLSMVPTAFGLMIINVIIFWAVTALFGEANVKDTDFLLNYTLQGNEYILVFIVTVVLAPIAEELLFRGLFYRYLKKRFPIIIAVLVSAAVFGILHVVFPPLFILGIAFALVSERYNSLYPSMLLHALNNTMVFLAFFAGQQLPH